MFRLTSESQNLRALQIEADIHCNSAAKVDQDVPPEIIMRRMQISSECADGNAHLFLLKNMSGLIRKEEAEYR